MASDTQTQTIPPAISTISARLLATCGVFLAQYPGHPKVFSADAAVAALAKQAAKQLGDLGRAAVPEVRWLGDGSCGKGNWASTPWLALYDSRETTQASSGVYPVLHFLWSAEDGSPTGEPGIRLGLGVSTTAYSGDARPARVEEVAKDWALLFPGLKELSGFWFSLSGQSRPMPRPAPGLSRDYHEGMVLERFLSIHDLETAEPQITLELLALLRCYSVWVDYTRSGVPSGWDEAATFLSTLRQYRDQGCVFASPIQRVLYSVAAVDDSGAEIARLNAQEPARCTASGFEAKMRRIRESEGRAPFDNSFDSTVALRVGYLQSPALAMSPDGKEIQAIASLKAATELLGAYFSRLRVDQSNGSPKLYKPAMVATVLEALDEGELRDNQISFDWLAPRFLATCRRIGIEAELTQAAYAFFHLASEPFWLLSYRDPKAAIQSSDGLTLERLRDSVRFASFKDTFWPVLQHPAARRRVLEDLAARWWPASHDPPINEEVLALAVAQTIRPALIDGNQINDPREEGYQHAKIIPKASGALTPEMIRRDPVASVKTAINASDNLLSQFERNQAVDLVRSVKPEEATERLLDWLYGKDSLEIRLRRLLEWGKKRRDLDEKILCINATVASYLLGVVDPVHHAFCKPEVYRQAAEALLGPGGAVNDPVARVIHTTRFYARALALFQQRHDLPFKDLMHVHIAFFKLAKSEKYPNWKDLFTSPQLHAPEAETPSMPHLPHNTILYGPPGTGKTYRAMADAVAICDGQPPADRRALVKRFNTLREEGRIEMVTFHQSYGYEEFVEGIRPILIDSDSEAEASNGQEVRYECSPGVFKRICNAAASSTQSSMGPQAEVGPLDLDTIRVWKMSLGNTQDADDDQVFRLCVQTGRLLLGYGLRQDFTDCDDSTAVLSRLKAVQPGMMESDFHVTAVNRLKNQVQVGDLVVVSDGKQHFRAIGRVTGTYEYWPSGPAHFCQSRKVEWLTTFEPSLPVERLLDRGFSQMTLYRLGSSTIRSHALQELLKPRPKGPPPNYVLIIDEINRGNVSKILGELITLIEPDKRLGGANELRVRLPYSGKSFGVPPNLFLLGTMNTADRSIAIVDVALRRRFTFTELMPDYQVIRDCVGQNGLIGSIDVAKVLEAINERIEALYDRDHQIGHSYFLEIKTLADLRQVICHQVLPLLQEYFYGDWEKIALVLGCPFDPESGKPVNQKNKRVLAVRPFPELAGAESFDLRSRVRCEIDKEFETAGSDELIEFFAAVQGKSSNGAAVTLQS